MLFKVLGPVLFALSCLFPFDPHIKYAIGIVLWMAVWWASECIPLPITSLLPLVIVPITGISDLKSVSVNYGNQAIFLFLGGFFLAKGIEKYEVHRFLASKIVAIFGSSSLGIFLGISFSTYFLSMWISNTSATLIMIPVVVSLGVGSLSKPLGLAAAYASTIGGMATLVGSPPNIIYAGLMKSYGKEITFIDWLKFGLPYSFLLLLGFIGLSLLLFRFHRDRVRVDFGDTRLSAKGKSVLCLFVMTAVLWIFREDMNLEFISIKGWSTYLDIDVDDGTVAILMSFILFLFRFIDWEDVKGIPWGALILFGGGFALSDAIVKSGLSNQLGQMLTRLPDFGITFYIFVWAAASLIITEFASNISSAAIMIPLAFACAGSLGLDPVALSTVVIIGVCAGFMFPAGTMPNALVHSYNLVTTADMIKVGFLLNLIAVVLNVLISYNFAPLFGQISRI